MMYIFGDISRLIPYGDFIGLKKLNIFNLFSLKADDTILVTRAWSPVIAFIWQLKNRPKIVQFADGLVTESNCIKKINCFPHFLYEKIYADALYVMQTLNSLPTFIDRSHLKTIVNHEIALKTVPFKSVTLVFGNDPYVGHSYEDLSRELKVLKSKLNENLQVFFSSPTSQIKSLVSEIFPDSKDIGRFSNSLRVPKETLIITTPSTVGYSCSLNGNSVVVLANCNCETMNRLFTSSDVSIRKNGAQDFVVDVLDYTNIERYKFDMPQKRVTSKTNLKFSLVGFNRLLKDLWCLLSNINWNN